MPMMGATSVKAELHSGAPPMEPFSFHAELFELRNGVLEMLADNGFAWLSDFSSVDLMHDIYGVEVCGIHDEDNARTIQKLLRRMFPSWRYSRRFLKEATTREPGWKVIISRDPEDFSDRWQHAN
jgi:hypothetical protein